MLRDDETVNFGWNTETCTESPRDILVLIDTLFLTDDLIDFCLLIYIVKPPISELLVKK